MGGVYTPSSNEIAIKKEEIRYLESDDLPTHHLSLRYSLTVVMFHNEDEHGYDRLGVSANYLTKKDLQELRKCIGAFL